MKGITVVLCYSFGIVEFKRLKKGVHFEFSFLSFLNNQLLLLEFFF